VTRVRRIRPAGVTNGLGALTLQRLDPNGCARNGPRYWTFWMWWKALWHGSGWRPVRRSR